MDLSFFNVNYLSVTYCWGFVVTKLCSDYLHLISIYIYFFPAFSLNLTVSKNFRQIWGELYIKLIYLEI